MRIATTEGRSTVSNSPPMTIMHTERLLVRRWALADADDAFAMYGDPLVTATLPDHMRDASVEETRAWLERKVVEQAQETDGLGMWAVEELASGRVVGGALLQQAPINGREQVEVGYHFARAAWGQGYATEVAQGLVDYGFQTLGLTRIVGVVLPDNTASHRVLQKIGMQREGLGEYQGYAIEVYAIERVVG
jgi:RimJ/RimL family protein N-acetyltransferase